MAWKAVTPLSQYQAQRIALLKPSALGDIVQSLPLLTALRDKYPQGHITWIVNRSYEPLLVGHPHLNATLPFERGALHRGWGHGLKTYAGFIKHLRKQQFDLVIDLQGLLRTGLMCRATGAARRVGLSTAREGATWGYTDVVKVARPQALHAVDRYWLIAEALGVGHLEKQFYVPLKPDSKTWAARQLDSYARPWIMVAPGARWETKRWLPAHYAELLRRVYHRWKGTAIFVGSDDDQFLAQAIGSEAAGPFLDLTGQTTLPHLAAVLARADAVVANDTGPLHLAVALGRPIVAPYTCTKVSLNGPYRAEWNAVESKVSCQGSYLRRCPRNLECMTELTPDRLWPILARILEEWEMRSRSA